MISRERILEAAFRVYARHGFRGATTRLIANEAGVNEVTLFRTFGSKSALLQAVLEQTSPTTLPQLSADPQDPERELTEWVAVHLERMREIAPLLVHSMGEMCERPERAEFACTGRRMAHDTIVAYVRALQHRGMADSDADAEAGAVMLVGSVMSDAFGRGFLSDLFPPVNEAPLRYVRCFLRMIGATSGAAAAHADESITAIRPTRSRKSPKRIA